MKRIILIFFFVLAGSVGLFAQQGSTQDRALEAEIRRLDLEAAKAILNKDEALIARFFTKDSVTNNPRNGLTLGSQGVIDAARANVIHYHSFDRVIESVQIRGGVAIVMGNEKVVMKAPDGKPGEIVKRRYTNIWMKKGRLWQIVARHANVICS